jgi:hypothetical protein
VLSYYDFGMDLLAEKSRAGFGASCFVCYGSARWGYPNENIASVVRTLRG